LVFRDRVIGIVTVQSNTTPGLYTERERDLLIAIASQASVALENAHVFRQTQQQAEQEATINLISQRIQSTTSVENALQVAIRELGRALGAKRTNVQLGLTSQPEINDPLIHLHQR
jgi:GAF domain-containing protein